MQVGRLDESFSLTESQCAELMSGWIGSRTKFSVPGAEGGITTLEDMSRTLHYWTVSAVSQPVIHHVVKVNGSFKTFLYIDWNLLYMDISIYALKFI